MSPIGSFSSFLPAQMPSKLDIGKLEELGGMDGLGQATPMEIVERPITTGVSGARAAQAPQALGHPSFGAILDNFVGEVNDKMNVAGAEQAKVLSGESTNLHQAMISLQEAGVAFSLMVEVRNKLVESYQELMRMQV
jgi:flagellar hook-basal body complex protein FliE